jgi:hypothetical protein
VPKHAAPHFSQSRRLGLITNKEQLHVIDSPD